jgi:hypothetical protein
MDQAINYARRLFDAIKSLNVTVEQKGESLHLDGWIEIMPEQVSVRTIAGIKLRDGYIAVGSTYKPSYNRDEPDDVDEVTLYEGTSIRAAIKASLEAIFKNHLDNVAQSIEEMEDEIEVFELEKAEGI